ncbi:MAG: rRNA pseudouridine synthase [Geminicoccaceae bacterium]|nr:rRNA pseudouridine synthase [Geminicoccaceae bacterium]MCS7267824.1 rRNA pseudouridine synthase [Geminicoccaceae bacterium]MCX7630723.1 rRNA pseudouridine synthase [Geminicoccaceae bacterium]MDW8123637.1 pseudouridine synthase [Geminicoccaceae bacterium]MDW8342749.1 pseudouridine synthase [Geminicoccaceae bacterium]
MNRRTAARTDPVPRATAAPERVRSDEAPGGREGERLAKRIARAGLCSRREAERWIREGRVAVDGRVVTSPALDVTPEQRVTVDGRPLPEPEPTRLFRWHKPKGVVTTARDPQGRPTYLERLPPGLPRLMPIGRLDINSEGLLLLTNDGELKRQLELPATGWTRRYRVRAFGKVEPGALARLAQGIRVGKVDYGPIEATLDRVQGANVWLTVSLKEGKNREVRRVLEHLGLKVNRLIRIAYGPFQLGNLPKGAIEEVPRKVLKEQLGAELAARLLGPTPRRARRRAPQTE